MFCYCTCLHAGCSAALCVCREQRAKDVIEPLTRGATVMACPAAIESFNDIVDAWAGQRPTNPDPTL